MTPSRMIESDYGNCGKGKVTEHFQESRTRKTQRKNVIDDSHFNTIAD
jgi:hypothetical protein